MINPTPVHTKNSPYSASSASGTRPNLPKAVQPPVSPGKKKRRHWRRVFALSILAFFLAAGTYTYAYFNSLKETVIVAHQGSSSSALSLYNQGGSADTGLLKAAGDGRFNLLIVGIGGDNHPGGNLTDSIQILSLDPVNKKVSMTSVPRDLYVNVPNYGYTKINATYSIGEQRKAGDGGYLLRQVIGNVLGVNISNFIMIDFSGAKDLVDQLGGIDVNVPKAITDPLFPCDDTIKYCPFSIKAGQQHMTGSTALKYARSRETTSDFDRSARQQIVIEAIKKKALSLGTLTDPANVLRMITTLGAHVRTDLQTDELRTFFDLYRSVPAGSTTSQVLDTSSSLGLLTASSGTAAGYISYPVLGQNKYDAIHAWFQKNSTDPYLAKEKPTVTVAAGAGTTAKQIQGIVAYLNDYGFDATASTAAVKTTVTKTQVDATGTSKPVSAAYLGNYFGIAAVQGSPLSSGSDLEVIYVAPKK